MFRRFHVRILICLLVSVAAIVGGFLIAPGIRHRHNGDEAAHSHSAHGHSHGHSHSGAGHTHRDEHDGATKKAVEEEPS